MSFKIGDAVIKTTGGNKMTVFEKITTGYKCIWFLESSIEVDYFTDEEIVTLKDYERILKAEEREDKINQLLG